MAGWNIGDGLICRSDILGLVTRPEEDLQDPSGDKEDNDTGKQTANVDNQGLVLG